MMKLFRTLTMALAVSTASLTGLMVSTPAPAAAAGVTELRLEGSLSGIINGVTAKGNARYRSRIGSSNFRAQIEDVAAADGTKFDVVLSHAGIETPLGAITIALRRGELDLNTTDGQLVPVMVKGDTILVKFQGNTAMIGVLN
jgi:hypothetical protein